MVRFFFDIASRNSVSYDYQGREFASLDHARNFAELVAMDFGCSDADDAEEVQVRNIRGEQLFAVPVQECALIAA